MKRRCIIAILTIVLISTTLFGQTKQERVITAYSYLKGQEYSLNLIKDKFPELVPSIIMVEANFDSAFGAAKERIKNYLSQFLSESEFKENDKKLISELSKVMNKQALTKEASINFIAEVENRAKGNIQSPILETLLSYQYSEKPQDELLKGFTMTFKTTGHLKSKNTNWQIKVPKSWRAQEADDPNIIQKFISDYGNGDPTLMLMVQEMALPEGYKITKEELNDFFTEKGMRAMVPAGGKFISFTRMSLDNNKGGMVELEQVGGGPDFKVKIRMVQFMFVRDNKMYILQGTVFSKKIDTDLTLDMEKYLPLYKLVANTIALND